MRFAKISGTGFGRAKRALRLTAQTARLMIGIRDYRTYLEHRYAFHRGEPVMTYGEFFHRCQDSAYAAGNGAFRGIC